MIPMSERRRPSVWHPKPVGRVEPPADADTVTRLKQEHYANFDLTAFDRRVEAFRQVDMSDPNVDVVEAVEQVLRAGPDAGYILPHSWDELPAGTILWRARGMTAEALRAGCITDSDLWEAPVQRTGAGRLNRPSEPLLYTCVDMPLGALSEARVTTAGSGFMLIGYEVREPIYVRRIGVSNADDALSREQQLIEERVTRFVAVAEVVSTPADALGTTGYAFTQRLLQHLYSLEPGWESGWIYASTLESDLLNVALEPAPAHSQLALRAVVAGQVREVPEGAEGDFGIYLAGFSDGRPRFGKILAS